MEQPNTKEEREYNGRGSKMPQPIKRRRFTQILEVESEYPYCALPPHFFERQLAQSEHKTRSGLVIEVIRQHRFRRAI